MSTIDSGVYLLESDVDASLAEPKHGKDKSARAMSTHLDFQMNVPLPSSSPARLGGRLPLRTSHSAPPCLSSYSVKELSHLDEHNALKRSMDSQLETDLETAGTKGADGDLDEDLVIAIHPTRLSRASSVGNSYGITGVGRGFDWKWGDESESEEEEEEKKIPLIPEIRDESEHPTPPAGLRNGLPTESQTNLVVIPPTPEAPRLPQRSSSMFVRAPSQPTTLGLNLNGLSNGSTPPAGPRSSGLQRGFSYSGVSTPAELSPFHSPQVRSPNLSPSSSYANLPATTLNSPQLSASRLNSPRVTRSRSNQSRRVSVVSGRQIPVARMPSPPPDPSPAPPPLTPRLARLNSTTSFISIASTAATAPPSPGSDGHNHYLGGRSIDNFMILGEAGRGAYGMVKRAREFKVDGSLGPNVIIKQIIKSRILSDCWKKHPIHGTIPIEIYVMNALSNTSFKLPNKRPWDPSRFQTSSSRHESKSVKDGISPGGHSPRMYSHDFQSIPWEWVEGQVVKGHPSICPLLDFWEDAHFYYLLLPTSSSSFPKIDGQDFPGITSRDPPPNDLFDLVEMYPQGLPGFLIRSYLGQMADALAFLHSKGICHRDIKDENVVLGPAGRCWLIDFGSSGVVRRGGWDTFSGTLDYAGPEILRGERYTGPPQDVWAFGVVAYVLLVGECPFSSAQEAQEGLALGTKALDSLLERCGLGQEIACEEPDGGGRLGHALELVKACLSVDVNKRPSFEKIMVSRYLMGEVGWARWEPPAETPTATK
ncbi:hypothetical protein RSOLAG22IIIB_01390 [Rhizoctonia solani]|uniref:Protein kinase domain-containing protein n=1 Tax=Rhizoctonia solani TaxID=456999 RepID=A0A0K6G672_9AGAM|nr:hypothetical protein RSOLAG22IIIB_01390 [Rhizoctonia solani]